MALEYHEKSNALNSVEREVGAYIEERPNKWEMLCFPFRVR